MSTTESDAEKEKEMVDIGLRIEKGEDVPLQDQLRYYRYRESIVSAQLSAGNTDLFHPLEHIRAQIAEINKKITDSGPKGGGTTGEGSVRDTHNPPH